MYSFLLHFRELRYPIHQFSFVFCSVFTSSLQKRLTLPHVIVCTYINKGPLEIFGLDFSIIRDPFAIGTPQSFSVIRTKPGFYVKKTNKFANYFTLHIKKRSDKSFTI